MAERRYSLRFSLPDGFLFVASLLGASTLIFLFGVYVGKAGEMRKLAQPAPIVRVPVAFTKEPAAPARPRVEPPVFASAPTEKEPTIHNLGHHRRHLVLGQVLASSHARNRFFDGHRFIPQPSSPWRICLGAN
jgi:hypothetical protein